ncbi:MAG: PAS domain-containing protein, partial [Erythrobacteraceae bacterium]
MTAPGNSRAAGANVSGPAPDARSQITGMIFAVLLIDEDGVITEVNHAAESLL